MQTVFEEVLYLHIITFSLQKFILFFFFLQKLILNQGQMDYLYFFGFHFLFNKHPREGEVAT